MYAIIVAMYMEYVFRTYGKDKKIFTYLERVKS